jgi:circadian clock protein KaiC
MEKKQTEVLSSGVAGLDAVLHGGFPVNHPYLIKGAPGTGKTTLALQFLFEGLRQGEKAVYVSFSESMGELRDVAESHNWPLEAIEVCELAGDISRRAVSGSSIFYAADVDLPEVIAKILEVVERVEPSRLVIDSLSELRNMAESRRHYRRALFKLKVSLEGAGVTTLFVGEKGLHSKTEAESLVHGVLNLEMDTPVYGPTRRRLEVSKIRGRTYETGYHDFEIVTGGLEVFPRIRPKAKRHWVGDGESVSSGVEALDHLLGGGLDRGTSSLFMGASGTGKSTVVMQFAIAAAERGEKVVMYTFDEDIGTIRRRASGMGLPLASQLDSGLIRIRTIDAAEMSPGQFAHLVRTDVEDRGADFISIDSINGYMHAMPSDESIISHLHDLLTYLGSQGIVIMLVMTLGGLLRTQEEDLANLSYLADSIVLLRYFEYRGAIRKSITVAKHRTGAHETHIRELMLGDGGVEIGEPIEHFRDALGQTPTFEG